MPCSQTSSVAVLLWSLGKYQSAAGWQNFEQLDFGSGTEKKSDSKRDERWERKRLTEQAWPECVSLAFHILGLMGSGGWGGGTGYLSYDCSQAWQLDMEDLIWSVTGRIKTRPLCVTLTCKAMQISGMCWNTKKKCNARHTVCWTKEETRPGWMSERPPFIPPSIGLSLSSGYPPSDRQSGSGREWWRQGRKGEH